MEDGGSDLRLWQGEAEVLAATPASPTAPGKLDPPSLALRDLLPELCEEYGVHVRFLTGEQATRLHDQMGGLAGLLRY